MGFQPTKKTVKWLQISDDEVKNILSKYDKKFNDDLDDNSKSFSLEYKKFKDAEQGGKKNWYESWCNVAERIIPVKIKDLDLDKVKQAIKFTGLRVTPTGANSFGILVGLAIILVGVLYLGLMMILKSPSLVGAFVFSLLFILIGIAIIKPLSNLIFFFDPVSIKSIKIAKKIITTHKFTNNDIPTKKILKPLEKSKFSYNLNNAEFLNISFLISIN